MARAYNINFSSTGGDRRNAFGGGNIKRDYGTLNSGMYRNQESGSNITKGNIRKIFSVGMVLQKTQQGNELFGSYTNNKLRQRRVDQAMTFGKYIIGIGTLGPVGLAYAVGDIAYRGISYGIKIQKKNREADYYRRLSGNSAYSGRRYRGDYV